MASRYDTVYDFSHPIHLTGFRRDYLGHFIYYMMLFAIVLAVGLLLFFRDGHLTWTFTLTRVLIAFPLVIIGYFITDVVKEDEKYTKLLLKKAHWTMDELMALTGKDAAQTRKIMTRVLEMSFVVDPACIIHQPGSRS